MAEIAIAKELNFDMLNLKKGRILSTDVYKNHQERRKIKRCYERSSRMDKQIITA